MIRESRGAMRDLVDDITEGCLATRSASNAEANGSEAAKRGNRMGDPLPVTSYCCTYARMSRKSSRGCSVSTGST
jgi:hypothetical protein